MPGRRRGARSGRGWDAAPPRRASAQSRGVDRAESGDPGWTSAEGPLWSPAEEEWTPAGDRHGSDPGDRHPDDREPGSVGRTGSGGRRRSGAGTARSERRGRSDAAQPPADPAELAREICLRQLAVRPRTRAELATALRRRGIPEEVASEVLERYGEVGLIDDALFAKAWVTSRHHGQGLARRALAGELRRRGVDGELVGEALEEIDPETEAATARSLVERKLRTMSSVPPEAVFRRLVAALARKGYPAGVAVAAVKEALAAREDDLSAFSDLIDSDGIADLVGGPDDLER